MTLGERIKERLDALRMSQSELARRVGVGQTTINGLIRGKARWSPFITKIARALSTTVEYLVGEIDDPDENAPPPVAEHPRPTHILMPVILPPEGALTRMFEVLLGGIRPGAGRLEQAQLLARRLPIGLSQLQDLRRVPMIEDPLDDDPAGAGTRPTHHPEPQS